MQSKTQKVPPILDDRPTENDALDFSPYRDTLLDIIADPRTRTPLTIGIYGGWGSGKTSLMRMVRSRLKDVPDEGGKEPLTVWFNAWQYGNEEALWRALLLHVLDALRPPKPEGLTDDQLASLASPHDPPDLSKELRAWRDLSRTLDYLQTSLYQTVDREEAGGLEIDWEKLGIGTIKGVAKIGLSYIPGFALIKDLVDAGPKKTDNWAKEMLEAFRREKIRIHLDHVRFLEQFRGQFEHLVREQVTDSGRKLVVFVDDLDRCLPEKAIDVLEAIKLFLDVEGCVFMLGLDQDIVSRGIMVKYRDFAVLKGGDGKPQIPIDGRAYLQKIIQLPFQLPPIEPDDMEAFVKKLVQGLHGDPCVAVFAKGLKEPNPRQVKRVMNVFLFLRRLADKRKLPVTPVRLAKVIVIQHAHPDLYDVLKDENLLLIEMERHFRDEERRLKAAGLGKGSMIPGRGTEGKGEKGPEVNPRLTGFVQRSSLRTLLTLYPPEDEGANFMDLKPRELLTYFTLTSRAAPEVPAAEDPAVALEPLMVLVPAGEFLMGTSDEDIRWLIENTDWAGEWKQNGFFDHEQPQHPVGVADFYIGRNPVKNSEYRAFIRGKKHKAPLHWEGDTYPKGLGGHPVVNVTWKDAVAYCEWLSKKTGREYRLPTEAEWEKAACWNADAGRRTHYPWGNEFDSEKCNTVEGGRNGTTSAGTYSPDGDSPFGVADMAGNVWEWCNTKWLDSPYKPDDGREALEGGETRVLRGGSWSGNQRDARCACRHRGSPGIQGDFVGFRVAASPGSP